MAETNLIPSAGPTPLVNINISDLARRSGLSRASAQSLEGGVETRRSDSS
jgi:hypothetical protein